MGGPESKSERTRNFRARGILGSLNLMGFILFDFLRLELYLR
jgi:hypothetical protein